MNGNGTQYVFERYVNFEFYKTYGTEYKTLYEFERYVNFEFYKTEIKKFIEENSLRDM